MKGYQNINVWILYSFLLQVERIVVCDDGGYYVYQNLKRDRDYYILLLLIFVFNLREKSMLYIILKEIEIVIFNILDNFLF